MNHFPSWSRWLERQTARRANRGGDGEREGGGERRGEDRDKLEAAHGSQARLGWGLRQRKRKEKKRKKKNTGAIKLNEVLGFVYRLSLGGAETLLNLFFSRPCQIFVYSFFPYYSFVSFFLVDAVAPREGKGKSILWVIAICWTITWGLQHPDHG